MPVKGGSGHLVSLGASNVNTLLKHLEQCLAHRVSPEVLVSPGSKKVLFAVFEQISKQTMKKNTPNGNAKNKILKTMK